jgi:hypothetical protein
MAKKNFKGKGSFKKKQNAGSESELVDQDYEFNEEELNAADLEVNDEDDADSGVEEFSEGEDDEAIIEGVKPKKKPKKEKKKHFGSFKTMGKSESI